MEGLGGEVEGRARGRANSDFGRNRKDARAADAGDTIFGMMYRPLALVLLGGCAQLAGIEETSGDGRVGVSLSVERVSIGTTVVRAPQDLSANTATYLVADQADPDAVTRVEAIQSEPGLWTAEIFNATPPVLFDLPDNPGPAFERLLALPNRDLLTAFDVFEHASPVVSDPNAMLSVNATLEAPFVSGTFELFIVGTWTVIGLGQPVAMTTTLAPPPFAVSTMSSLTGRPVEQITVDDAPFIMRRVAGTNQLDGLIEITPFAQTGNDALTGTIAPITADRPLSLAIDPAGAAGRFSAVRPAITSALGFSWAVSAAPGHEVGFNTGPLLNAAGALMTDTTVTAMYANPFEARGWRTVLAWSGSGTRTTTPPGQALPVTLRAGMSQLVLDPDAGLSLDFPAGLPEQVSIGGTSLSVDGVQLPVPTGSVEVTAIVDRPTATVYSLEVRELVPNAAVTALEPIRTLLVISRESSFTLPPETFKVGSYYTLRVQTIDGLFPNIATGDLRTRALPFASSFLDSGVFQVMP